MRTTLRGILVFLGLWMPLSLQAQPLEARIDSLLEQMTLREKVSLLHGTLDTTGRAGAGYVPGIPRLGIPALWLTDGPAGVRTSRPATALPVPLLLASTFDTTLAYRYGRILGWETRRQGHNVLLAPMVNLIRVPEAGRNFETLGEDPLLAARLVRAEIRGIQDEGVVATVKHYVANNFEQDRMRVNVEVDERTLREIYLPAFRAASEADVGAIMCAYNRINGRYACDHPHLLNDVLRHEWGFRGWVMSDWFAGHQLRSILHGLDQEMPGYRAPLSLPDLPLAPPAFADSLELAVRQGWIPEEAVDRAVRRILRSMLRYVGHVRPGASPPTPEELEALVAEGAVLLQNRDNLLPLQADAREALLLLGPAAATPIHHGGGSSRVMPSRVRTPLDALRETLSQVTYLPGIDIDGLPIPPAQVRTPDGRPGWQRLKMGEPPTVDSVLDVVLPPQGMYRWEGRLTAPTDGRYTLRLQTSGGLGMLEVNGQLVAQTGVFFGNGSLVPTSDSLEMASYTLRLTAGEEVSVVVMGMGGFQVLPFFPPEPGVFRVRLNWTTPERRTALRQAAVEAARRASSVVIVAHESRTEGRDRSDLHLDADLDSLITAVARVQPRTTVVLNVGGPVLMPWRKAVASILLIWYPGQEGGRALARLLLGAAGPGGRLPVTFPQRAEDAPTYPAQRHPGINGTAIYEEGIFMGYRWYDHKTLDPAFPFGFGLSYTTFTYKHLQVERRDTRVYVWVTVNNTGSRRGTDVVQVYVVPPVTAHLPVPRRKLAGWARVALDPGESRTVTVTLDARAFQVWDPSRSGWSLLPGRWRIEAGASSRHLPLQQTLDIAGERP